MKIKRNTYIITLNFPQRKDQYIKSYAFINTLNTKSYSFINTLNTMSYAFINTLDTKHG